MGRKKIVDDEGLVAAARKVFARVGHTATTRDVALEAGVSQAVLYQRFPDKNSLFFMAMMPSEPDLDVLIPPLEEDAKPLLYIERTCLRLFDFLIETIPTVMHLSTHPEVSSQILNEAHEHLKAQELEERLAQNLSSLKSRGAIVTDDCQATARTIIAVVHSKAMHAAMMNLKSTDASDGLKDSCKVIWNGLKP